MSQLSSSSNTINKLGTTGLGAQDSIGHKLYFFQQLNAKIIGYVAAYSTYGGIYYVEGDITDFLDSYSYFWINTREMGDKNVFSLDALGYSYIEDRMCTEIYINATALDASNYTADKSDLFANICGRYDATDLIKEIGNFNQQLVEEGSIGNSSASTIDITINDEERLFYDKVNRIGYFYPKKVLTEIFSVADRSEYASATKLYSTFLKVKDLTKYYSGSDFENGWLEFITGEAAGSKALIIDSNGYNINVRGQFAHCYSTSESYPIEVTKGDRIRLIKQDVYWFRLDLWHRAYIDEKVSFSGKIDLSSVRVQDQERSLTFKGYNTLKDLMAKDLSHLSFDTGLNLPRLKEVKTIFLSKCVNKGMKLIQKSEVTENPLASIKITEVAFDVSEGWHIFDYHPQGNLFRFDLGFWYQAVDEGSFENSTNSIFIAGHSISTLYNNEAEIPDHTLASNTDEENVKIERKWHGEWCKFTVDTKEDFFVGSVNNQKLKDGTFKPKKFSGLPSEPFRLLFYVNADRSIGQQTIFNYSFDNGAVTIPNILFDYAEEVTYQSGVIVSAANETYAVGMGAVSYRKAAATYPWNDLSRRFRLGCFKKFNGMYIKFRNEDSSYTNQLSRMLQRLQIRFSDGNDDYGSNFISNINSRYLGGYCLNDPVANNNLRLEIYDPIAVSGSSVTSFDSHYTDIAKMHLLCTSGNNAFQSRKIDTASEVVGDFSQIDVVLKSGYDHNIDQNDKFTIINKDDDVRFIDVSDTFKDGKNPDVLARESDDLTAGTFYDIIANHHTEVVYSDLILKPGDKVYVGHRDKFNSFALGVDIDTTGGNDYSDIAWFLRRDFFNIEYWNGNAWKKANNVSIVPSSVTNLKDSSTTIYSDDDIIKYKVFFEADDWNVGSYNHNSYSASGAPSNIDEDKIYSIRVTISSSMPVYLKYVSLCKSNDLNLAVIWNDIKSWSMNSSYIYSGKMIVDTLTNANLNLNLYSIELCAPGNSKIAVIEARPIEKFVGYNGSELYAMIDYNNIDPKVSEDVILYDNTKSNNISHLPVNINYQYLIQKILDDNGFKYNKDINNSLDHFNSANKNVINLIGSGYDGSYPIDVGWDSAFVTEDLANYDFSGSYRHISIIRSDGEYKAYAVHSDLGGVDLWTSDDMKTWANQGAVIGNIGSYEILAIDVVKNRDDEDYAFYITARTTDRYKLFIVVTAVHTTVDMNNAKEIVELLNRNIGSVSVLHIKGVSDDTSDCRRIAWVTVYDGESLDGDNIPDDDSEIWYYENIVDIDREEYWKHDDGYGANYAEIDDAKNPAFTKGNYGVNDGNDVTDTYNMYFAVLFANMTNKLYKTYGPYQDGDINTDWSDAIAIESDNFLEGFSCIKDGSIYNVRDDSGDDNAFTMIPAIRDAFIIYGVAVGGTAVTVRSVDIDLISWSDDIFLKSVLKEVNGWDWFIQDSASIVLERSATNDIDLYFGFRKEFGKVDVILNDLKLSDRLLVQYWNGIEWADFDILYQNKQKITDSKIIPIFGFYFDIPCNWSVNSIENIVGNSNVANKTQSLYWIKVSVPDADYSEGDTLTVKGFKLCYTSLFLTSGRSVYLLENWSFVKQIFTFIGETDRKIIIDSISYDKEEKNVLINVLEKNPYEDRVIETHIFDVFGNFKSFTPIWDNGYQHINLIDTPESIYRIGYENEVDTEVFGSSVDTLKVMTIGSWYESYIESLYKDGAFSGYEKIGYNIPIPKSQFIRKFSARNTDWNLDGDYWDIDFINNILLGRAFSHEEGAIASMGDYLFFALTNSGLLNEELINAPFVKLAPGYYSALERSFLNLAVRYDILIADEIDDLPVVLVDDTNYLISNYADADWDGALAGKANQIATYVDATNGWSYVHPANGTIIYISDTSTYKWWNGSQWRAYETSVIWPGRISAAGDEGIGLEFTMGQEGVKVPYFRPYDARTERFIGNGMLQYFDNKAVTVFRDIPLGIESQYVFGHYGTTTFPFNLKPTCAVEVPDLSACKDSVGPAADRRICEPNYPAMAFGSYMFKDVQLADSVEREEIDTQDVNPYGVSAINLFKMSGKVVDWKKALYRDGAVYTDITEEMNYKDDDNEYSMGAQKYIYLCLDYKPFAVTVNSRQLDLIAYYDNDENWTNMPRSFVANGFTNYNVALQNDLWTYKTAGFTYIWDPFRNDWKKKTFQGTEGYWIRLSTVAAEYYVNWIVCSGYCLWDSMRWWDDYNIVSDKAPVNYDLMGYDFLTDAEKRFFDTYVPMSIEYDAIRKRITGCFWNFKSGVNKYYPFSIQMDSSRLRDSSNNYWSWEQEELKIVDSDDYNYLYKIQSLKSISPIDTKCVLVDDANPDGLSYIANIKNWDTGQSLFDFELGS